MTSWETSWPVDVTSGDDSRVRRVQPVRRLVPVGVAMPSPPQVSLPKFVLFITACAVGGFGLGALIAAVLGEKFWHGIMG